MNELQKQLEKNLNELATMREKSEALKNARREMMDRVQQSEDYIRLENLLREGESLTDELEAEIRRGALALYEESCELPSRVAVKQFTVVNVTDELKAKEWCIAHFTPALKLDGKVFEKAAKDGNIPAELATVTKEARAQIATKL